MTEKQFREFLDARYDRQILWLNRKSTRNKRLFYSTSTLTATLATIAPILTATGVTTWVILAVTGSVALLTGFQQLFRFKDLWTTYRATAEAMKREWSYLQAGLRDYKRLEDAEKRLVFVDRIEEMLAQENAAWVVRQNPQNRGA